MVGATTQCLPLDPAKQNNGVKGCGCFATFDLDDLVPVTRMQESTTFYLCNEHMQLHKQKEQSNESILRYQLSKNEDVANKEINALVDMVQALKLTRLRKINDIIRHEKWSCTIHHGFITARFRGEHSRFCPSKKEPITETINKGISCVCKTIKVVKFIYVISKGRYLFQRC